MNRIRSNIIPFTAGFIASTALLPDEFKTYSHTLLFKSLRVQQIYFNAFISRSRVDLPDRQCSKFIPHEYSLQTIRNGLSKKNGTNVSGGVRVLWGPHGCGKTTYTIHQCNELVKEGTLEGVVLMNECRNNETAHTSDWLNECLGHDILSKGNPLSSLFPHQPPKHTVFIFDQFDNLYRKCQNKELLRVAIKSLAEDGEKHDSFLVVLCISDPDIAAEMLLLNGGRKIRLLDHEPERMKWTESEVLEFLSDKALTDDQITSCVKIGTPQFCKDIAVYKTQAELDDAVRESERELENGRKIVRRAVTGRRLPKN
mmetsp:Transcript_6859/g.10301  ORF Transcript_6859/g.10301 Transcript_6859/m.10301 type:complete len:313 (+) Transcript_6859:198-1136(+)|eukprot:CAMPEP_0185041630 /NCGR_PEP_ID=MMETSP1103-20130426/41207_1 /TAXON_ID=36769 /ORGANISM="Paraphysomonas bandaiensis, Strain Caron Lab Isolate" /LENGTH=312 /DNA_ID=CAMNT_0027581461 /DNA_START=152 /DNA_END=1090 /DNA_ORIENTATION=-